MARAEDVGPGYLGCNARSCFIAIHRFAFAWGSRWSGSVLADVRCRTSPQKLASLVARMFARLAGPALEDVRVNIKSNQSS